MKTLEYSGLEKNQVKEITCELQNLLADFQIFYSNLRGFHWNIKGRDFFTLHEKFEELYDGAASTVDEIAERILQLGGTPASKYSDYLKASEISETGVISESTQAIENILDTYKILIARERKIVELAAATSDEVTVGIMDGLLEEQEKMVWMFTAYLS